LTEDARGLFGLHTNVLVLGLTSTIATFANTLWIFFFPLVLAGGGYSASAIGLVYALRTLVGAAVEVPVGAFTDRFGRKTSVVAGTAIPALSVLVLAFSSSPAIYSAVYVFLALGGAFFGIGMWAMIIESSKDRPATSFGAFTTMAGWAAIFAPVVGGVFFAEGRTDVFLFSSFLYAAAATGRAVFLKETLHGEGTPKDSAVQQERKRFSDLRPLLREAITNRTFLLLMAACSIYNLFLSQLSFVVPLYSEQVLRFSTAQIGVLFSVFLLVDSQSQILFGWLADRFGYSRTIVASWVGEMGFMMAFAYSSGYLVSIALFSTWVAFGAMDGPAFQALLGRVTRKESRGTSVGIFGTLSTLISVPSQIASGFLFSVSPRFPFFANLAFGLAALALFCFSQSRPNEQEPDPESSDWFWLPLHFTYSVSTCVDLWMSNDARIHEPLNSGRLGLSLAPSFPAHHPRDKVVAINHSVSRLDFGICSSPPKCPCPWKRWRQPAPPERRFGRTS
jgi:MFS family permease